MVGGLTFSMISALIERRYSICARGTYFSSTAQAMREPEKIQVPAGGDDAH